MDGGDLLDGRRRQLSVKSRFKEKMLPCFKTEETLLYTA